MIYRLALLALFVFALSLPGCATKKQTGALIGAGVGAGAGAAIDKRKRARGAAIGAVVGAGAGYVIGDQLEEDDEDEKDPAAAE